MRMKTSRLSAASDLAFACDIVFAASSASFIQSFSKIGVIPDSGGTFILPRLVGLQRATALTMLAEKLPADQALAVVSVGFIAVPNFVIAIRRRNSNGRSPWACGPSAGPAITTNSCWPTLPSSTETATSPAALRWIKAAANRPSGQCAISVGTVID